MNFVLHSSCNLGRMHQDIPNSQKPVTAMASLDANGREVDKQVKGQGVDESKD